MAECGRWKAVLARCHNRPRPSTASSKIGGSWRTNRNIFEDEDEDDVSKPNYKTRNPEP